jgi:hypothetical protein
MVSWLTRGLIAPSAGDVEMLRLLGVAVLPILGGLMIAFAMGLAQPPRRPDTSRQEGGHSDRQSCEAMTAVADQRAASIAASQRAADAATNAREAECAT